MNPIEIGQFQILHGTRRCSSVVPDEEGRISFGVVLPDGWEKFPYAVLSIRAEAEDKPIVRFGLAESEAREPLLSMNYMILQKCRVKIPFPLERDSLKAEHWFLPPWPGVFKGSYEGRSIRSEEVRFAVISVYAKTLISSEIPTLSFTDRWEPSDLRGDILIDRFGQRKNRTWAGKTLSSGEMEARLKEEYRLAGEKSRYPDGWSAWGGWKKKRSAATGWFRCEKIDGRWWLVDPDGFVFFSNGVCYGNRTGIYAMEDHLDALYEELPPKDGIYKASWTTGDRIPQYVVRNGLESARKRTLVNFPRANMIRVFGEKWLDAWIAINVARMKSAGINTLGIGVNDYADEYTDEFLKRAQMPYVITLKYFPLTKERIFRDFPDVFSPEYESLALQTAKTALAPYAEDPYLIGYFVTNEPEWYSYEQANLGLKLLECGESVFSKTAMTAFLEKRYGGISGLNEAWETGFESFDDLLKPVSIERPAAAVLRDSMDFHRILVERYGSVISECFRKADPHHLNLGMRYARLTEKKSEQAFCKGIRQFDVFSFNRYGAEPVTPAKLLAKYADMPAIVGEWHIGSTDAGLDVGGLYYTDSQAERAKAIRYYLEQSTQEEHLVGVHYFEYSDQPYLGRFDGECYQIGLIDVCNRPYREVFDAFGAFARRMYPLLAGECRPDAEAAPLHRL